MVCRGRKNIPGSRRQSSVPSIFPPCLRLPVAYPVWHMTGGDVLACRFDVGRRVVEKDVRTEGVQERTLVAPTQEQGFVDAHAPAAQGEDHALVRGRGAGGDQRGADRRILRREGGLQPVERGEKAAERPHRKRLGGLLGLVAVEGLQALFARYALALVAEDHRVAVEGDAQLLAGARRRGAGQDGGGGDAGSQRTTDVLGI